MRLTFVYDLKMNKIQEKIIKELMWHSSKVYNMLNYEVKEGKEKINTKGSINIEGSKIYKKYRKENWHSEYLHSHTLEQIILNAFRIFTFTYIRANNIKLYRRL